MKISLIVAASRNGVIGKDNQLLWKLSSDLKRFKALTSGHHIIMGRKTYESIGKPLPNRTNIIISRNKDLVFENCIIVDSVNASLKIASDVGEPEAFVIGGADVYLQFLALADSIYLTLVEADLLGDAFFPIQEVLATWKIVSSEEFSKDDKNEFDYQFINLIKN